MLKMIIDKLIHLFLHKSLRLLLGPYLAIMFRSLYRSSHFFYVSEEYSVQISFILPIPVPYMLSSTNQTKYGIRSRSRLSQHIFTTEYWIQTEK